MVLFPTQPSVCSTNHSDRLALLHFKQQITAHSIGALSFWNESIHFCQWHGVRCSDRHPNRVTVLDLNSQKLEGTLSPHIGNLSFLRVLNMSSNNFYGPIPQEIGRLFRLRILYMPENMFEGEIPANLTHCSNLRQLNLANNKLSGTIPRDLNSLSNLTLLELQKNNLKGGIPSSLGNLTSLEAFSLSDNRLTGSIPDDLCRLQNLNKFFLATDKLTGMVPACLFNHSKITVFDVTENQLDGKLPADIGFTLPHLVQLYLGINNFRGLIPLSLSNASRLEVIALYDNQFIGQVPNDLGKLQNFRSLVLNRNQLGSQEGDDLDFILSMTNCSNLKVLDVAVNSLKGLMPNSIANLSTTMRLLYLGTNQIYGSIPVGIDNLFNLNILAFNENNLTGKIPTVIRMFSNLYELWLNTNQLSGEIPDIFSNLTRLASLVLQQNNLHGKIPSSLRSCPEILDVILQENRLTGTIPKEVIGVFSILNRLNLSYNALSGLLPPEIGNLQTIDVLDISGNRFSGHIPGTLGKCLMIQTLKMAHNLFEGEIPKSWSTLKNIVELDLSHNNLSGEIPNYLVNFTHLIYLNLSYNELEGSVSQDGVFANVSVISIVGNSKLCGGVAGLKLFPCHLQAIKKKGKSLAWAVVIPVVTSICFLGLSCIIFICHRRRKSRKELVSQFAEHRHPRISYAELLKATNNFSASNLIGTGSYGSVYKGVLDHINTIVAVKVFNLEQRGGSKSFLSECNALRNLRHRNLLKIVTSCSSIDFQGNDFKALVFKFMPHGSLDDWLHDRNGLRNLSFLQRLNICIDVASALNYLHHHCQQTIVHCDLKPNNILLDDDMTAQVADFGLAKIFSATSYISSQSQGSSLAFKGSIGYIAPEYGMGGHASMEGDVYSFGILLLEVFTGKRPTDDMFQDEQCLHTFANASLPEQVMNIADPRMLLEGRDEDSDNIVQSDRQATVRVCLISLIKLGAACSVESPVERMNIAEVFTKLHRIRNYHQGVIIRLE